MGIQLAFSLNIFELGLRDTYHPRVNLHLFDKHVLHSAQGYGQKPGTDLLTTYTP